MPYDVAGWTGSFKNSYVEALTLINSDGNFLWEQDQCGRSELGRGHAGVRQAPGVNATGVLLRRGHGDTERHRESAM